jgi:hypothetical protein
MAYLSIDSLSSQVLILFLLAIPVACISWTLTHEEVFREVHEYCLDRSRNCTRMYQRKFFYALTCEYCLSHYVSALLLVVTQYQLLFHSWRGYLLAGFSLVWIANYYMAIFGRLRLELKNQKLEIAQGERDGAKKSYDAVERNGRPS